MEKSVVNLLVTDVFERTKCFECSYCEKKESEVCIFYVKFGINELSEPRKIVSVIPPFKSVEFIERLLLHEECLDCHICGSPEESSCFFNSEFWIGILDIYNCESQRLI